MPGGLLQIASSGVQDSYLTGDPQITFFKKIYRRHTNFSMQTIEVSLDHTPDFGQSFFINLPNNGDLIHRCFFEITIPKLNINDNSITNTDYIIEYFMFPFAHFITTTKYKIHIEVEMF